MENTQVLIAGAGPTGLALALWLTRMDIRVRIIDKTSEAGTTSRATVFHARNLEFYHQLDIDQKAIAGGVLLDSINLWVKGKKAGSARFGRAGEQLSPYPYVLVFPQDKHEKLLIQELDSLGVQVERNTELVSFENRRDNILAVIRRADRTEACEALYLAGCDGAHSIVRKQQGIEFPGGDYARTFYVADAECSGPVADGQMHAALDEADFFLAFPMKDHGNIRLIGMVRHEQHEVPQLQWQDVSQKIISRMQVSVSKVNWFSTYRVHHRVAGTFRLGRTFLLGDAGHIHSPVGGQGMNTGIGDAINLAWKLRDVIRGHAGDDLLDTYETERIAFARHLVKSTDRAFTFVTAQSRLANFVRLHIVPRIVPMLFGLGWVRRSMFRTVSQIDISYRRSAMSGGKTGIIKGGDRLPWTGDNFDSLQSLDWQIHVYGQAGAALIDWCKARSANLQMFAWNQRTRQAGLKQDAVYVIRPDAYIGLVQDKPDMAALKSYWNKWIKAGE